MDKSCDGVKALCIIHAHPSRNYLFLLKSGSCFRTEDSGKEFRLDVFLKMNNWTLGGPHHGLITENIHLPGYAIYLVKMSDSARGGARHTATEICTKLILMNQ